MGIQIWHIIGIAAVLLLIAGVSLYSGKKVKNAADFTTGGGKVGRWMVCGTIMGSLVGGQATVGTAQLAFNYGAAAWWFTLGSGIGCLALALGYAVRLRRGGSGTLLGIISNEYGSTARYVGSLFSSVGIFISVIAQVVSAVALISSVVSVNSVMAAVTAIALMAIYVVFGGLWGAGMGGVVKLILLYLAAIAGCIMALTLSGGFGGLLSNLKGALVNTELGALSGIESAGDISGRFFSLVARGPAKDLGSGLSLLLGVLSTQIYGQAVMSAKSDGEARRGALLSTFLIPPIGAACILIGLFMRGHYITTAEIAALQAAGQASPAGMTEIASTAQVFPMFVIRHMNPLLGGVVLGTLFITIVGGGAGLSLGTATVLLNDLFKKATDRLPTPEKKLLVTRLPIIGVLIAAAGVALGTSGAVINDLGFLSMGLRGAVIFIPLTCALFLPGRVDSRWVVASEVCAAIAVVAGKLAGIGIDPLFIGVAASLLCCLVGMGVKKGGGKSLASGAAG